MLAILTNIMPRVRNGNISDWYAVVIYDRRSNEATLPPRYRALVEAHLRRFYLNEMEEATEESLGVKIVRLVVASQQKTGELAKQLVNRAREELTDTLLSAKSYRIYRDNRCLQVS